MMSRRWLLALMFTLAGCASPPTDVASQGWQPWHLPGKRTTSYLREHCHGRLAWRAVADVSASVLRRRTELPVTAETSVEFSWWLGALLPQADLSRAEAADSPVRVIFAFAGDTARLSLRNRLQFQLAEALTGEAPPYATLMYVWDNHAEPETVLPGARSDRVQKIVLEKGADRLGRWLTYRRSLMSDFQRAFNEPPGNLIGIGLLTDTDNTGAKAEACYGEVLVRP